MKKIPLHLLRASILISLLFSTSCTTRSSGDQWKDDDARYKEQLKRYPDRESTEQQRSEAEAARKADNLRK